MTIYSRIARSKTQGTSSAQRAVVAAIRRARKMHPHYGPSVRELADDLDVATTDVWQKLVRLRRDGLVAWEDGIPRTIRVVEGK
jgi:DNA-binding MarR family transcriptional regulator